tara:strand:- start:1316 stop:1429 length:114 start_codon:yes stop_codon:yes gene_type:complete
MTISPGGRRMHVVTELKGVHKVRKKLASGKIVYYYYA